jgi:hypothetical protein
MEHYTSQLGHRSRKPWLLLITPTNEIRLFTGAPIPGIVAIIGEDYEKNGKWSSTTYRLALADGVRTISGHEGWEQGSFREGLLKALPDHPATDRWSEIANALGVSLAETQRFLREWRPKEAEHLNKIEADLAAIG